MVHYVESEFLSFELVHGEFSLPSTRAPRFAAATRERARRMRALAERALPVLRNARQAAEKPRELHRRAAGHDLGARRSRGRRTGRIAAKYVGFEARGARQGKSSWRSRDRVIVPRRIGVG
jgi:hypothetical protein